MKVIYNNKLDKSMKKKKPDTRYLLLEYCNNLNLINVIIEMKLNSEQY